MRWQARGGKPLVSIEVVGGKSQFNLMRLPHTYLPTLTFARLDWIPDDPRHSKLKWTLGFTLVVASSLGGVAPAQAAPVNPAAVAQLQTVPAATTVSLSSSDFFRPNFQNGVLNNGIDPYSRSTEEQIRRAKEQIPNALFVDSG